MSKILRTGSKKERRNNRFKRSNKFKIFQSIFGKIFQILYLVSEKKKCDIFPYLTTILNIYMILLKRMGKGKINFVKLV